ncbi:MAG: N-acetylmuramoyl-L-alanine amidase, partial [Lachnospiraceae bacterium]|nr:N-acetylmuramoyl-L-alanine amidase [Lachnospiraceae bacterium]
MAYTIILDPGHGGSDPGATYNGRQEKDDALGLATAVGQLLENAGFEVEYTRTTDVYDTPFEKATIGNNAGGDLFVSFHRNSSPTDNMYNGVQTLVYNDEGLKAQLARNINANLAAVGFEDRG